MENKILKTANEIRVETQRKLEDALTLHEKFIGLEISVEIKINNIPPSEMPANSEERTLQNNDAYLFFVARDKLRLSSETYEVLEPEKGE